MAYPKWPAELPPLPLAQPFSPEPWTAPDAAETDHLLPILRRRSSLDAVVWQVAWAFDNRTASPTQYQLFLAWVRDYLGGGVLPFIWPVWDGVAFVDKLTWFLAPPSGGVNAAGLEVVLQTQLLILDPPKISKATLDANATITTGVPA